MPDSQLHEIVGVIHIHSSYSDGTKSIEEIAAIGECAGLDFLMFSDHMTLQPLRDGHNRFYGKVAAIIGYEIEDSRNENHFLAFGIDQELPAGLPATQYVTEVQRLGGLGIIAHPDEIRNAIPRYPSYPWTAWEAQGFHAIEVWNHMSAWMELLRRINVIKLIFTPRSGLRGPTDRILKKWDELAHTRPIAGIGSADVHAHAYRKGPLKMTIFPYKIQFRSIRTHLILPDRFADSIGEAQGQILDAIRCCRVFISNFRWGDARGFRFYARSENNIAYMGGSLDLSDDLEIFMTAPHAAEIRLIVNGIRASTSFSDRLQIPVQCPGIYRVELLKNGRGWVYSNHIRIFPKR
jgi:hypothetical protein